VRERSSGLVKQKDSPKTPTKAVLGKLNAISSADENR
jgi:hypothetical protein